MPRSIWPTPLVAKGLAAEAADLCREVLKVDPKAQRAAILLKKALAAEGKSNQAIPGNSEPPAEGSRCWQPPHSQTLPFSSGVSKARVSRATSTPGPVGCGLSAVFWSWPWAWSLAKPCGTISSISTTRAMSLKIRTSLPDSRRRESGGAADRWPLRRMATADGPVAHARLPVVWRRLSGRAPCDQRRVARRFSGAVVPRAAADDQPANGARSGTSERRDNAPLCSRAAKTPASGARSGTSERREGRASGPERNNAPASGARSGTSERREGRASGPERKNTPERDNTLAQRLGGRRFCHPSFARLDRGLGGRATRSAGRIVLHAHARRLCTLRRAAIAGALSGRRRILGARLDAVEVFAILAMVPFDSCCCSTIGRRSARFSGPRDTERNPSGKGLAGLPLAWRLVLEKIPLLALSATNCAIVLSTHASLGLVRTASNTSRWRPGSATPWWRRPLIWASRSIR